MAEILKLLEINETYFVQLGLFILFFIILTPLYLNPFQKLLEKRNHKLGAEASSASELLKQVEAKLQAYELALNTARTEARKQYEAAMTAVRSDEDAIVQKQRDLLKQQYQAASLKISEQKSKAEAEFKGQITQISDQLVDRLLAGK